MVSSRLGFSTHSLVNFFVVWCRTEFTYLCSSYFVCLWDLILFVWILASDDVEQGSYSLLSCNFRGELLMSKSGNKERYVRINTAREMRLTRESFPRSK